MPDFNPNSIKQIHSQCWIRLHDLPQEYWRPQTLASIGMPIVVNEATKKRVYGHYARILVDIDLTGKLHNEILVERENFASFFCWRGL